MYLESKSQSVDEVRQNWEQIKAAEKEKPQALPELLSAKLSRMDTASNDCWDEDFVMLLLLGLSGNIDGVWAKFYEELAELQQAIAQEAPNNNKQNWSCCLS